MKNSKKYAIKLLKQCFNNCIIAVETKLNLYSNVRLSGCTWNVAHNQKDRSVLFVKSIKGKCMHANIYL